MENPLDEREGDREPSAVVDEDLSQLIEAVTEEHAEEGAAAMADQLRDRVPETRAAAESPADIEE
ncbi:hypothetical protein LJR044_003773 [Microbacterium foliorum]